MKLFNWTSFETFVDRAMAVGGAFFLVGAGLLLTAFAFTLFVSAWEAWK